MNQTQCRQADAWDWVAQITTSSVKIALEHIKKAEQQKPVEKRDLRLQALSAIGIPVCDYATYRINRDLCVPIA